MLIKYFDYTIHKQKGSLLISYGLINTHSTIVKPAKVQITTDSRNLFQKKLDVLELTVKQATQCAKEERGSRNDIPGCKKQDKKTVLAWRLSLLDLQNGEHEIDNLKKTFDLIERTAIGIALENY